jgi:hypothetical protein
MIADQAGGESYEVPVLSSMQPIWGWLFVGLAQFDFL